ncbi:MAG: biopolymer transporter ExbD [Cyanobacteria bacterium P01_A01_bin.105]
MRVLDTEVEEPLEINIVPMIDVIFAILAFFILSTLFLTRTEGLPVNLPNSDTAEVRQSADFAVTVNANGAVALDKNPIDVDQLQSAITADLAIGEIAIITLQADRDVPYGRVIEVMDQLRRIENARLGMATQSEVASP